MADLGKSSDKSSSPEAADNLATAKKPTSVGFQYTADAEL
jgi:hypothetical protein